MCRLPLVALRNRNTPLHVGRSIQVSTSGTGDGERDTR